MFTSIGLENIRLFRGTGWSFPLSGLTVLCGTNSAGKSTLLKALLLLRQSLGLGDAGIVSPGALKLNGAHAELGTYRSLVSNNDISQRLCISVGLRAPITSKSMISYLRPQSHTHTKTADTYLHAALRWSFTFGLPARHRPAPANTTEPVVRQAIDDHGRALPNTAVLQQLHFSIQTDDGALFSWHLTPSPRASPYPTSLQLTMPRKYFEHENGHTFIKMFPTDDQSYVTFPVTLRGLLPEAMHAQMLLKSNEPVADDQDAIRQVPLPPGISHTNDILRQHLKDTLFIGPLRAPARRYYMSESDVAGYPDAQGGSIPYELRDRIDDKIFLSLPGDIASPQLYRIRDALDSWLKYLRTGTREGSAERGRELRVTANQNILVELSIRSPLTAELHSLADSGFGYSQALPILARAMLSPSDSCIIIEQPELHLNPALQVRLAEFFIACVHSGRQLIIETHSEHIVNMLRVLAAESTNNFVSANTSIVFLGASAGQLHRHDLSIQPDGSIPEWPKEFFGETLDLGARLLRAQKNRRISRRS